MSRLLMAVAIMCSVMQATGVAAAPSVPEAKDETQSVTEAESLTASVAFQQLGALVGEWQGVFANGRAHRVTYRLSAGGSVLVETWTLAPGRESITMYHLDGDELLATHYCPQGNQPRLRWVAGKDSRRLSFELKDGGNIEVPGGWHQHLMWLELGGPDTFTRSETYVENGSTAGQIAEAEVGEAIVYTRVVAGTAGS